MPPENLSSAYYMKSRLSSVASDALVNAPPSSSILCLSSVISSRSSSAAATWGPSLPRPLTSLLICSAELLTDLLFGSYFLTLLNKSFLTSFLLHIELILFFHVAPPPPHYCEFHSSVIVYLQSFSVVSSLWGWMLNLLYWVHVIGTQEIFLRLA